MAQFPRWFYSVRFFRKIKACSNEFNQAQFTFHSLTPNMNYQGSGGGRKRANGQGGELSATDLILVHLCYI